MKKRGPFGRLKCAVMVTEENYRKEVNTYQFSNSNELNPLMVSIKAFSRTIAELRAAQIISWLVRSKDFNYDFNV